MARLELLQRSLGTRKVNALWKAGALQTALQVGAPDDKYERQADAVAEQVVNGPAPVARAPQRKPIISRMPSNEKNRAKTAKRVVQPARTSSADEKKIDRKEEKEEIKAKPDMVARMASAPAAVDDDEANNLQAKSSGSPGKGAFTASNDVSSSINDMRAAGGRPLPAAEKDFMESRMGHDFSDVRVHDDARSHRAAESIQAKAFTVGNTVAFNKGEYKPGTSEGRKLLAHELTHVVQQGRASEKVQRFPKMPRHGVHFPGRISRVHGSPIIKDKYGGKAFTRLTEGHLNSITLYYSWKIYDADDRLVHQAGSTMTFQRSYYIPEEAIIKGRAGGASKPWTIVFQATHSLGSSSNKNNYPYTYARFNVFNSLREYEAHNRKDEPSKKDDVIPVKDTGIVTARRLRLRRGPSTGHRFIKWLPYGTKLKITGKHKETGWLQVVDPRGVRGFVSQNYVLDKMPDQHAVMYRTKSGDQALAIAAEFYSGYVEKIKVFGHKGHPSWGRDLRYFVNAIVYANKRRDRRPAIYKRRSSDSWKDAIVVRNRHIWIPGPAYAIALSHAIDSGSITKTLDTFVERQKQKMRDFGTAYRMSKVLMGPVFKETFSELPKQIIQGVWEFLKTSLYIYAGSVILGALFGGIVAAILSGGAGALHGAAAGAKLGSTIGLAIIELMGMVFIAKLIVDIAGPMSASLTEFFLATWNANGDRDQLKKGAQHLAEGVAFIALAAVLGALAYLTKKGTDRLVGIRLKPGTRQRLEAFKVKFKDTRLLKKMDKILKESEKAFHVGKSRKDAARAINRVRRQLKGNPDALRRLNEFVEKMGEPATHRMLNSKKDPAAFIREQAAKRAAKTGGRWKGFTERYNANFEKALKKYLGWRRSRQEAAGGELLQPIGQGAEGAVFWISGKPHALKRWFASRLVKDFKKSVDRLRLARRTVHGHRELNSVMEVVKIHKKGPDYIVRDFTHPSTTLSEAIRVDPGARLAYNKAVRILEKSQRTVLRNIYKKLRDGSDKGPSANLHWSPVKKKIIVIDMQ